jgi:putative restriction endonuclease
MRIFVYPTDHDWFRFLRARSPLDEVNFWQPGGSRAFTGLQPGELFLFRLKSPINRIAGGGIFAHGSVFPLIGAWEAFGEKNGTATFSALFAKIEHYRAKAGEPTHPDSPIGCIILESPFFLHEGDWREVPADYHPNLVQGKGYDATHGTGRELFEWATLQLSRMHAAQVAESAPAPMFGDPTLVRRRLGQGGFRVVVSDAYGRRCAITGEKTFPVLDAAHIQPVSRGGQHQISNGLLMRSDIHKLFDLGYVTVTPAGEFRVSSQLREEWKNGLVYYALERSPIHLPESTEHRPDRMLLEWHGDEVFRP